MRRRWRIASTRFLHRFIGNLITHTARAAASRGAVITISSLIMPDNATPSPCHRLYDTYELVCKLETSFRPRLVFLIYRTWPYDGCYRPLHRPSSRNRNSTLETKRFPFPSRRKSNFLLKRTLEFEMLITEGWTRRVFISRIYKGIGDSFETRVFQLREYCISSRAD